MEHVPEAERKLHRQFFSSCQNEDGGFAGREGPSDLYYTAFALRGLVLLGELEQNVIERAAAYLRRQMNERVSLIDLISLLFAARQLEVSAGIEFFDQTQTEWSTTLADTFETLRRADGGYAKSAEGHASSTYQTFLIALSYQLIDRTLPDAERACEFVLGQQREDGGFVEIGVMRRSGTNPTAAAIGTLTVLGEHFLTDQLRKSVAQFLLASVAEEGGFRANTQIPIADLLSTFTALQTLKDVGAWDAVDRRRTLEFVCSLQGEEGGFYAAAWDEQVDVEYSFYGVASLGLLLSEDP